MKQIEKEILNDLEMKRVRLYHQIFKNCKQFYRVH